MLLWPKAFLKESFYWTEHEPEKGLGPGACGLNHQQQG